MKHKIVINYECTNEFEGIDGIIYIASKYTKKIDAENYWKFVYTFPEIPCTKYFAYRKDKV